MTDETPTQVSGGDNLPPIFLKERQVMILTKNTNGSYFWREAGNRLYVEVDGKPYELKLTVAQHERYQAFVASREALRKAEDAARKANVENLEEIELLVSDLVKKSHEAALEVLEIAFNPKRDAVTYTKDQILEMFDEQADLIRIVANTWVSKKVLDPSLSAALDPLLAPREIGA